MNLSSSQQSRVASIKQSIAAHREGGVRRHIPDAIRLDVLSLIGEGMSIEALSRQTSISAGVIHRWRRASGKSFRKTSAVVPPPLVLPVAANNAAQTSELRLGLGAFDVSISVARLL